MAAPEWTTSGNNAIGNAASTGEIQLQIDGSTKAVVDTDGNVGIGTTTPNSKLAVFNDSGTLQLTFNNDSHGDDTQIRMNAEDNSGTNHQFTLKLDPDEDKVICAYEGNDVLAFDSGGNVGIGVTDPDRKLEILDGGGNAQLKLSFNGTDNAELKVDTDGYLTITPSGSRVTVAGQLKITGGSPAAGKVLTSDANGLATWETNSPSAGGGWTDDGSVVRLTTAGDQVGIGTASPYASSKLHTHSATLDGIRVTTSTSNHADLLGNALNSSASSFNLDLYNGGTIYLKTASTSRVTIDGTQTTIANNLYHTGTGIGFFSKGSTTTKQTVSDPSSIVTTQTAGASYGSNERLMLDNLKTDVTNLRSTLLSLTNALQAYNLV